MTTKKNSTQDAAAMRDKCPKCGRRLADRKSSTPLSPDTRLDRAATSAVKALNQIEAEQGRRAAKAAMSRLTTALEGYAK